MSNRMTWDVAADRRLLLAIIKVNKVKIDHAALAAEMSDENTTCTETAIRRRLDKLNQISRDPKDTTKGTKRSTQLKIDDEGAPMSKRVKKSSVQQPTVGKSKDSKGDFFVELGKSEIVGGE
ncbi:hypothetical protein ANO11243_048420 [Dothideomycetidae sp. 11243]|nr:hypothetical protein ANO11243_048420 [fungal sp. No.11243]